MSRHRTILYLMLFAGIGASFLYFQLFDTGKAVRPSVRESRPDSYLDATVHLEAYGDSITYGKKFSFTIDQSGHPVKTDTSFQGWPELLGHLLTEKTGTETAVWNLGYPGDRTNKTAKDRLPESLNMKINSDLALLLMGTNDSNDFEPTPSGAGCHGDLCLQSFKGEVISFIERLKNAGRKTIYLGLLPPAWGSSLDIPYDNPQDPSTATRNVRIQEYNQVIVSELSKLPGVQLGPDLYSCFLSESQNRFSMFEDALHPNALGQTYIAALWLEVLTRSHRRAPGQPGSCAAPIYVLDSLDSYAYGHKQNLLEAGGRYYTDETFALREIPHELQDGIWILQANSEKRNRQAEYLDFDVGSAPVTVYIAYDPAGAPPVSSSHHFQSVELSSELTVSDKSVGNLALVRTADATGIVNIGGNLSAGGVSGQQSYVVVVVP